MLPHECRRIMRGLSCVTPDMTEGHVRSWPVRMQSSAGRLCEFGKLPYHATCSIIDSPGVNQMERVTFDEWTERPELLIRAFGPGRVERQGRALTLSDWTYSKAREMLFYLICNPARTKEQIGVALWPDTSTTQLHDYFRSRSISSPRARTSRMGVYEGGFTPSTAQCPTGSTWRRSSFICWLPTWRLRDPVPHLAWTEIIWTMQPVCIMATSSRVPTPSGALHAGKICCTSIFRRWWRGKVCCLSRRV